MQHFGVRHWKLSRIFLRLQSNCAVHLAPAGSPKLGRSALGLC